MPVSERQDDSNEYWQPRRIAAFLGIGALLYLLLFGASEGLVRRWGDQNPFYRIMTSTTEQDWLILSASHAMPLGFGDSEDRIEAETGQRILNLSATGNGRFVWQIAAERFFRDHQAKQVLVVDDAFAFRDPRWNEDRMGDTDFMPHIPWDSRTLAVLFRALRHGLPVRTLADYATGFSKIGNADRFQRDIWEVRRNSSAAPVRPPLPTARELLIFIPGPMIHRRLTSPLPGLPRWWTWRGRMAPRSPC